MRTTKLHRVVREDFPVQLAFLQSAEAVACAENEGWPVPEDESDPAVDLAGSCPAGEIEAVRIHS